MSPSVELSVFTKPSNSILVQSRLDVGEAYSVLMSQIKSLHHEAVAQSQNQLAAVAESMQESLETSQNSDFARQVAVLRGIAEELAIYQVALVQRQKNSPLLEELERVDEMVQNFYSIVNEQKLELEQTTELITVFHQSRLYSGAFDRPVAYIVGPLWTLNQTWNGIAYAHEVGHYVFHSVKGLADELLATLMVSLGALGYSPRDLRIWGLWLEEIFSDIFCLMRIGPAAIHSAQRLAFWAVPTLKVGSKDDELFLTALLSGRDVYHPSSYLRVKLGLEAQVILENGSKSSLVQKLEEQWESILTLVQGEDKPYLYVRMEDGSSNPLKIDSDTLLKQGRSVLELVLNTPLFALASADAPDDPRAMRNVFYRAEAQVLGDLLGVLTKRAKMSRPWPTNIHDIITEAKLSDIIAAAELALDEVKQAELRKLHDAAIELTEMKREQIK